MEVIYNQYLQAVDYHNGSLPRADLPVCTRKFRGQYGLPCRHKILKRLDAVAPLGIEDCDHHWWIGNPDPDLLSRLQEPDPNVILPRGRPRNGPTAFQTSRTDNTTRRHLSHDEVANRRGRTGSQGNVQRPRASARAARGVRRGGNTLTGRVANIEATLERLVEALEGGRRRE